MEYNDNASLDTSEIEDTRGSGGGFGGRGVAVGGGGLGVVGLLVVLAMQFLGGGSGDGTGALTQILEQMGQGGQPAQMDNTELKDKCKTGADANKSTDCATVANIDSIQAFWAAKMGSRYQPVPTVWFSGQVSTGCGGASSASGPFYCPTDKKVYIDLSFYKDLQSQFRAQGGLFPNAYVLAHEYGHHVQDLLGITNKVRPGDTGPTSGSVRLELQADCFAGTWAKHASEPGPNGEPALIKSINEADISAALDTASRIGDDWIQKNLGGGRVDQSQFTHGTSAQREKWFTTGIQSGDPNQCDTFSSDDLG